MMCTHTLPPPHSLNLGFRVYHTMQIYEDTEQQFIIENTITGIAELAYKNNMTEEQLLKYCKDGFHAVNSSMASSSGDIAYEYASYDTSLQDFFYDIGGYRKLLDDGGYPVVDDVYIKKHQQPRRAMHGQRHSLYRHKHHHQQQHVRQQRVLKSKGTASQKTSNRRMHASDASTEQSRGPRKQIINGAVVTKHIVPKLTRFTCTGPFLSGLCKPGYFPAATSKSLLQIHLFIFCVAIFHVATTVFVILGTNVRLLLWLRWQTKSIQAVTLASGGEMDGGERIESTMGVAATRNSASMSLEGRDSSMNKQHSMGSLKRVTSDRASVPGDELQENAAVDFPGITEQFPQEAMHGQQGREDVLGTNTNEVITSTTTTTATIAATDQHARETRQSFFKRAQMQLERRETFIIEKRYLFLEILIWLGNGFIPSIISRREFLRMREAYLAEHSLPYDYNFIKDIQQHLDFDLAKIVGVTIDMWVVFILFFLFLGVRSWVAGIVFLLSFIAMYAVNVLLCAMVRYAARGRSRTPKSLALNSQRFYRDPRNLAYPIRMIIFIYSMAFSSATFFAWQFGSNSCLFSLNMILFSPLDVPYYVTIIVILVLVSWISLVTIPAWTCTMHLQGDKSHHLVYHGSKIPQSSAKDSASENGWTNEELSREIARLMTLQRQMTGRNRIGSPLASPRHAKQVVVEQS